MTEHMITALDMATRCVLPVEMLEGGEWQAVTAAKESKVSGRVYVTLENGEELDVPRNCQLWVRS